MTDIFADQPTPWADEKMLSAWLDQIAEWERQFMTAALRCIFHTRLVIPGSKTISGRRYAANPRQIIPVREEDRDLLLSMTRKATGCGGCGASLQYEPQHYFEEVQEV